ncbi:MAG: hypothetical protein ABIO70_09600, partial [Pseudomonadota bacterium]
MPLSFHLFRLPHSRAEAGRPNRWFGDATFHMVAPGVSLPMSNLPALAQPDEEPPLERDRSTIRDSKKKFLSQIVAPIPPTQKERPVEIPAGGPAAARTLHSGGGEPGTDRVAAC